MLDMIFLDTYSLLLKIGNLHRIISVPCFWSFNLGRYSEVHPRNKDFTPGIKRKIIGLNQKEPESRHLFGQTSIIHGLSWKSSLVNPGNPGISG